MSSYFVAAFYLFTPLDELESLQASVRQCCEEHDVRGIVLLAREGINSTISGSREGVLAVLDHLRADPRLAELQWKESQAASPPFRKLRVRLKREIVTMGVPGVDPRDLVGTYVKPEDWNDLISDPEVVVIDTRNDYEVEIGTFKDAVNPDIESFSQLPAWLEANLDPASKPKVAMFCTGGIRCEKSTSLLKRAGVDEVFHLDGGILKYLEQVPEPESLWEGECFVFDERVSVGHGLATGPHELCRACRFPLGPEDKQSSLYTEGVSCPRCHDRTTDEQKQRFADRQQQVELSRSRGERHLGP